MASAKNSDDGFEMFGARKSDIILKTDSKKCKVCKTGDLVSRPNLKEDCFMIYTRDGTVTGKHVEYRCNNRQGRPFLRLCVIG